MAYAPFYGPAETPNPGAPQILGSAPTGLPIPRFLNSLSDSISLFNFTPCTQLSGLITAKTGAANARVWTATLTNIGSSPAAASQITGLTLLQTFGPACTPVITTPFPVAVGDLAPATSGSAGVTIDFSSCNALARFTTTLSYSSDAGAVTGSKTLFNQFR
jgi:endo-1,4-beta-xylanase